MKRERVAFARVGDVEAELHASAFAPAAALPEVQSVPGPEEGACACTHHIISHGEAGCLHGCDAAVCARTGLPEVQA